MGGYLRISENPKKRVWVPARWIFDNVLEGIGKFLIDNNSTMSQRFYEGRTFINGGFLILDDVFDSNTIENIYTALEKHKKAEEKRKDEFMGPEFYDAYIREIEELQNLLKQRIDELKNS